MNLPAKCSGRLDIDLSAHPATVTTPEEDTFRYTHDRAARCMEVITEQVTTRYAYNHINCATTVTNPPGETTKYYYDYICNLTKVVNSNQTGKGGSNVGTEYIYDVLDQIIMAIDALGNVHATPRDTGGNILKEVSSNTYDPETREGEGILYEYDVNHHTKIYYPDGGVERIKYDAAENIVKK